jgi:hypothetical protein
MSFWVVPRIFRFSADFLWSFSPDKHVMALVAFPGPDASDGWLFGVRFEDFGQSFAVASQGLLGRGTPFACLLRSRICPSVHAAHLFGTSAPRTRLSCRYRSLLSECTGSRPSRYAQSHSPRPSQPKASNAARSASASMQSLFPKYATCPGRAHLCRRPHICALCTPQHLDEFAAQAERVLAYYSGRLPVYAPRCAQTMRAWMPVFAGWMCCVSTIARLSTNCRKGRCDDTCDLYPIAVSTA